MASEKKVCLCCGNTYEYCNKCSRAKNQPAWMWKCDTEECNAVFDVISGYNMGIKNSYDVRQVLDQYNVTDYSKYKESIANTLNELFGNKKFKKNKKKEMDIELNEETVTEEVIESPVVVEDPVVSTEVNVDNFNGISDLI